MLLLNIPGEGEKAMTSGTMFDGIQTEEAKAVEEPMFKELGTMESMKKPEGVTAAVNWYRYACHSLMQHRVILKSYACSSAESCHSQAHHLLFMPPVNQTFSGRN